MRHILFALCLLLCFSVKAQVRIAGNVMDEKSGIAISNASVYFPEAHVGTATDSLGNFSVVTVPAGSLLMTISHIGYQARFINLSVRDTFFTVKLVRSMIQMEEVVVTGSRTKAPDETTLNIVHVNQEQLQQTGALNISDALSHIPGISQLTTGPGISKPVIRGLSGNRIQVNVNGLRFDNQQWQDEHGLGLSDPGVERVEIIRGAASVLYGSDAMGGVLNIIEERPAPVDTKAQQLNLRLHSNTFGISATYGYKSTKGNRWRNVFAGVDSHADYQDGNNQRVLNSRFASYTLKATWGKNRPGSTHVKSLSASHSMFGFVFDSLSRKTWDGRITRSFDGPHHAVSFVQASSQNTWFKSNKETKLNFGWTSNLRLEDEGGGGISLSMLLNTAQGLLQQSRPVGVFGNWTYGTSLMAQSNTNFGGRIIVPDAFNGEASAFSYYQYHPNRWLVEIGGRYDKKYVETFATSSLNVVGNESPTQEVVPFVKFYNAFNFSAGSTYSLLNGISFKANVSTGYRPGNLAELSSNGLHEGTLRWEIGKTDAAIEQNINLEGSVHYSRPSLRASLALYTNRFKNYFYLSPTGAEYFGFAVYHFEQTDAELRGGEAVVDWSIPNIPLQLNASYSFIDAQKRNGDALPFIPANRISTDIAWSAPSDFFHTMKFNIGVTSVLRQNNPAEFETETGAYSLLHAGWSATRKRYALFLTGTNLTNKNYYDHLSRYKYYGIANMGRSIVLGLKITM
jgi:iron complex outermembrane recepter protein